MNALQLDWSQWRQCLASPPQILLPSVLEVSIYQTGFVPKRLIHNNVITLDMVIKRIKREIKKDKNLNPIITFYDFEKAFDSISHAAIQRTLEHIRIPSTLTNTILDMLEDTEVKIQVNGQLSNPFITKRGTKQGDPLSPTLFALVAECMSAAIRDNVGINGIDIGNKTRIKIEQFADDTVTIAENIEEHKLIDEIIQKFCSATASKVNNSNERYLGFNFNHMGIQSKVFEINDRLQILMKQNKTISSTLKGRSAILKSYLLSQLTYHIAESKKMEDAASDYLFSKKWLMSKTRAGCDIDKGGLNFWDLKLRCSAQKAWVYENHLNNYEDSKLNKISSPFTMAWL
ncbi:hypothetical protein ACTA71_011170 [Dictyostelium dimigraforme]